MAPAPHPARLRLQALSRVISSYAGTIENAAVLAILLWLGLRTWGLFETAWSFTTDDAYITLRYSRHLAAGHGLVWNVGDPPVEGFSNLTFVALGAAALRSGFDPVWTLKLTGAVAMIGTIPVLYWIARRWVGPVLAALAPAMFTAHVGAIWWAVSGLETGVFVAGVTVSFALTLRGLGFPPVGRVPTPPRLDPAEPRLVPLVGAGVVMAVMGITRPEAPLIAAALGAMIVIHFAVPAYRSTPIQREELRRRGVRAALAFGLAFGICWGAYFVARALYFGRLLPNTVYCKQDHAEEPYQLLWRYWQSSAAFTVVALIHPVKRWDARHVFLLGVPLAYLVMLAGVDPIVGYYDRLFLVAHASVVVGATITIPALLKLVFEHRGRAWRDFALALAVLSHHGELEAPVTAKNEEFLEEYENRAQNREDLGMWLDARLNADQTFVIGDAGVVPYLAHARVLDAFCLNSAETTRAPIDRDAARWVEWMFAQAPEILVVHSRYQTRLKPRDEYGVYPLVIQHPDFTAWYDRELVFPDKKFSYYVYSRAPGAPGPRGYDPAIAVKLANLAAQFENIDAPGLIAPLPGTTSGGPADSDQGQERESG